MATKKRWSGDEKQQLAQFYSSVNCSRLPELLEGRSVRAIRDQAHAMGLKKSQERLREMGQENVGRRWAFKKPPQIET